MNAEQITMTERLNNAKSTKEIVDLVWGQVKDANVDDNTAVELLTEFIDEHFKAGWDLALDKAAENIETIEPKETMDRDDVGYPYDHAEYDHVSIENCKQSILSLKHTPNE